MQSEWGGDERFQDSLWQSLTRPLAQTRAFDRRGRENWPWQLWSGLVAIAVIGSCIFGGSLSLTMRSWQLLNGALWITLSAGAGWCVLMPALILVTKQRVATIIHACLVTMAYGEGVLFNGAIINLLLAKFELGESLNIALLNFIIVVISNIVMAAVLTRQLRALGVPGRQTLLCWIFALNGSGLLFFAIFRVLLQGGR